MTDDDLLSSVEQLMVVTTDAAYSNIVVPLLANLYTSLLRTRLARQNVDLAAVDVTRDGEHDVETDPNAELDRLAATVSLHGADSPEASQHLDMFLARFGHFSDSGNDFSVATWAEQPDLVMQLAVSRSTTQRGQRPTWDEVRVKMPTVALATTNPIRRRAVAYQARRDRVSSLYTYGYGLFRNYFLELGRRLVERGILDKPDEIMYLTFTEVRDSIDGGLAGEEAQRIVTSQMAELERVADLEMPEVIYGEHFIPAVPGSPEGLMSGVPTSRGHYRGPVRVVNGIADFDSVDDGDIIVIPFSDVGWTPLFAKAGAVIAASGGMLSHSSIVAREYGIPCIVSVAGAMRLPDGAMVTVDGYRGEVVVD